MSTKKVKDGIAKQSVGTKPKKSSGTVTKEVFKSRTTGKTTKDEEGNINSTSRDIPSVLNTHKKLAKGTPIRRSTKSQPKIPVTPPSTRVTKNQFFPSKKMYSNAITAVKPPEPSAKTRNSTHDTTLKLERPRTATLRKGSIVNNNIVGPDAPVKQSPDEVITPKKRVIVDNKNVGMHISNSKFRAVGESSNEYEDDFESYESDFEGYQSSDSVENVPSDSYSDTTTSSEFKPAQKRASSASTDDERKLDSGNYELPDVRHRQILDNIKESIEKENVNFAHHQSRSNMASLSDEGFEEGKSLQFINFLEAQQKYLHRKSIEMRKRRGEEIMNMIRLDYYSFTLLDFPSVPYEDFIKIFGKRNTVQASLQTGDDDVNEEVQTEQVVHKNKWTQYPPQIERSDDKGSWESYKCSYLGVGSDEREQENTLCTYHKQNLDKFLLTAGNLILNLQAEASIQVSGQKNKSNLPFSDACIVYNTQSQELAKDRCVKDVSFSFSYPNKILTAHGTKIGADVKESIVLLWNLSNVNVPEKQMVTFGEITCCTFSSEFSNLVCGGLSNGTIVIWNITDTSIGCRNIGGQLINIPTYSTEVNYGHCSKIISIVPVYDTLLENRSFFNHKATEVCSLDVDGEIIIWGVIFKENSLGRIVENQGWAAWGSVVLTINSQISLGRLYKEMGDFRCTDLGLSHFDPSNLYVPTNYGIITHCQSTGGKANVKKFLSDAPFQANCLDMCPFSSQYFLAGFDNGDLCCYSKSIERPLMVLSNKDSVEGKCGMQAIQWSRTRPLLFYTKDVTNTIHVWNLKVSDMMPIYSVPFKDDIVCMKLSPSIKNVHEAAEHTFMMIATQEGIVYVHSLDDDHNEQSSEAFESDKKKFFNYINKYV